MKGSLPVERRYQPEEMDIVMLENILLIILIYF